MATQSAVEVSWADDTFTFDLPIGQLRELEKLCNAGPQWIVMRLEQNMWRLNDVWETLRLSLIGGGMTPAHAFALLKEKVPPSEPLTIAWGPGEHKFALPPEFHRKLEDARDAGLHEIAGRLISGSWRLDDIRETIRLALMGGGMSEPFANDLVQRYVDRRPKIESIMTAHKVLSHFANAYAPAVQLARASLLACVLMGVPGDDPEAPPAPAGESMAEEGSQTDGTPSPISTAGAGSSDSLPAK